MGRSKKNEDGETTYSHPADPVDNDGEWVLRSKFKGKKSFGFFVCECGQTWKSAHTQSKYKQGCKSCNAYTHAELMWVNTDRNDKSLTSKKESKGHHDKRRCEACKKHVCDTLVQVL